MFTHLSVLPVLATVNRTSVDLCTGFHLWKQMENISHVDVFISPGGHHGRGVSRAET